MIASRVPNVDTVPLGSVSWECMSAGVEKVRDRLRRATAALENAGVPYAVIGGNAVAAWVSKVDESVVRNTRDVDLLLQRSDFEAAKAAITNSSLFHKAVRMLGQSGFSEMFFDGPASKARDAVYIVFADEKEENLEPLPSVSDSEYTGEFQLLSLEALVTMKLTSYRRKDQVYLLDMMEIGQVDASWLNQVPPSLGERLQVLLDDPKG